MWPSACSDSVGVPECRSFAAECLVTLPRSTCGARGRITGGSWRPSPGRYRRPTPSSRHPSARSSPATRGRTWRLARQSATAMRSRTDTRRDSPETRLPRHREASSTPSTWPHASDRQHTQGSSMDTRQQLGRRPRALPGRIDGRNASGGALPVRGAFCADEEGAGARGSPSRQAAAAEQGVPDPGHPRGHAAYRRRPRAPGSKDR